MTYNPWNRVDVGIRLTAHEYAAADLVAKQSGYSSGHEMIESFVKSTILDALDTEETPYLPAWAHRKRVEEIEQLADTCADPVDPD